MKIGILILTILSVSFCPQVKSDDVEDAKQEFDSYIAEVRNRMEARVQNISLEISYIVGGFEFDFSDIFSSIVEPIMKDLNADHEVITMDSFFDSFQKNAHELVEEFSYDPLYDIIDPQNQQAQSDYLNPIVAFENKLVVVATFRDSALECLKSFHSSFHTAFEMYWDHVGYQIAETLENFNATSRVMLSKIESDIKLYTAKGKLFCKDLECLQNFYLSKQDEFKQKFDDYTNDLVSLKWPTLLQLRSIVFDNAEESYSEVDSIESEAKKCINQ